MTTENCGKPFEQPLANLLHGLHLKGLKIGTNDAQRVALAFRHAGSWSHAKRVRVLTALLARTDAERLIIAQLAPFMFPDREPERDIDHQARAQEASLLLQPGEATVLPSPPPSRRWFQKRAWLVFRARWPFWVAGGMALLLLIATHMELPPPQSPVEEAAQTEPPKASTTIFTLPSQPLEIAPPPPPPRWPFVPGLLISLGLMVPALLGWRNRSLYRQQTERLKRVAKATGHRCYQPGPPESLSPLPADAVREAAFLLIAPSEESIAPWLEVTKTVTATARRAGLLTLVFDTWKTQRPLLFIEDVALPMARWPDFGRQLASALARQSASLHHRFMIGLPDRLYREPNGESAHPLEQVLAELGNPVVLLLSDASALDDLKGWGHGPPWLASLGRATWLHPLPAPLWGEGARHLAQWLSLVPLTREGLQRMGGSGIGHASAPAWQPPLALPAGERLAALRAIAGLDGLWWLAAGAVLDQARILTARLWWALSLEGVTPVDRLSMEKAWMVARPTLGGDGHLGLPTGLRESLLAHLQQQNPKLLTQVVRWIDNKIVRDQANLEPESLAGVQARWQRIRLLNSDANRRQEARTELDQFVAEGFGDLVAANASAGERRNWRGIHLARAYKPEGRALAGAVVGLVGLLVSVVLLVYPPELFPPKPDFRFLTDIPFTREDGSPLLLVSPQDPLRFYDRHQRQAQVMLSVDGRNIGEARVVTEKPLVWEYPFNNRSGTLPFTPGFHMASIFYHLDSNVSSDRYFYTEELMPLTTEKSPGGVKLTWSAPSSGFLPGKPFRVYRDGVEIAQVNSNEYIVLLSDKKFHTYRVVASGETGPVLSTRAVFTGIVATMQIVFVAVPGGTFEMGCGAWQSDCNNNEKPLQTVTVAPFEIGRYEVTQGQWKAVMGSNPSGFSSCGDNCPVEQVSWNDIQAFIQRLNALGEGTYRLPTEVEWEYACRSGGKPEQYCGGNDINSLAWYIDNSGEKTHPVGQKTPNGLGIYDMSGNVWEWTCSDWGNYDDEKKNHAKCGTEGSLRVNRGGSWDHDPAYIRFAIGQDAQRDSMGFRLARTAP